MCVNIKELDLCVLKLLLIVWADSLVNSQTCFGQLF